MKTPTAWRINCDYCKEPADETYLVLRNGGTQKTWVGVVTGERDERHYCSTACLIAGEDPEKSLAAIWDAGWDTHRAQHEKQAKDPSHPITRTNPFRETEEKAS